MNKNISGVVIRGILLIIIRDRKQLIELQLIAIKIDLSSLDAINCQLIAINYLYIMNNILVCI